MSAFLCGLWPYLAGGLVGWLLAGWFARRLKHVEPPVEKIIEKEIKIDRVVDNPEHLSLIGKLEADNSKLLNQNSKIPDMVSRIAGFESSKAKATTKIVEKKVKVEVDNPKLLARIKELEAENMQISGLESKLKSLEGVKPKTIEKEVQVEKLVDNPDHLKRISALEAELKGLKRGTSIDIPAARAAGIVIKDESDLTAIEGIGPKINDLIKADGINTFAALSDAQPSSIQTILDNAGSRYTMANPGTWPDQAHLAANNRWPALKALQDVLIGGVYPDGSASGGGSSSDASSAKSSSAKTPKKAVEKNVLIEIDTAAAKSFGFNVSQKNGQDDFTVVEGIGPKINGLIHDAEIHTFTELAKTMVDDIQKILDDAGSSFALAKPGTWPAQADMAASNRWETLKAWQDEMDGGKA